MDHKVSKDMISSGMIPSGEKTQADLGRTQYGSAPSPSKLMDAYKSMYEHHQKDKDGNTIPHEGEEVKEENINELKTRTMLNYIDKASDSASKELDKAEKTTSRKKEVKARLKMDKRERGIEMAKDKIMKRVKEEYDLVYEHFIGEGFSEEETYERMSNLTEEQLDEFMKALATRAAKYGASLGGNTPAPKMGPARPNAKPGQTGFKASSASEVVSDVNARKREASAFKAKPLRDKMDAALTKLRAGDLKFGSTSGSEQKPRVINKKFGSTGSRSNQTEGADLFDVVSGVFVAEGYEEKDAYKVMSQLTEEQLNEIAITGTIATLGAGLLKGMLGAGKVAAAAGKGALSAGKAVAAKSMTAAKTVGKGITSAAKTGMSKASDALGKVSNIAKDKAKGMGDTMTNMGKSVGDDVKDEIKRKILQGNDGGSNKITKTGQLTAPTANLNQSADLFDIVKGQLLDEGLSEEEIKDIMLTLTPDEILSEYKDVPSGQMNYASYGVPKPKSYEMDSLKRQTAPGGGKDYKIEDKKNVIAYNQKKIAKEEYKNFDPKKPDPKQMAAQAKQEKNRQKFNDPMGVKNKNIGGQGLDPMDK